MRKIDGERITYSNRKYSVDRIKVVTIKDGVVYNHKVGKYRDWTGWGTTAYKRLDIDATVWGAFRGQDRIRESRYSRDMPSLKFVRDYGYLLSVDKVVSDLVRRMKLIENNRWVEASIYREIFMLWQDYGIPLKVVMDTYMEGFYILIQGEIEHLMTALSDIEVGMGLTRYEKTGWLKKIDTAQFVTDLQKQPKHISDELSPFELHDIIDGAIVSRNRLALLTFMQRAMLKSVFGMGYTRTLTELNERSVIFDIPNTETIRFGKWEMYKSPKEHKGDEKNET